MTCSLKIALTVAFVGIIGSLGAYAQESQSATPQQPAPDVAALQQQIREQGAQIALDGCTVRLPAGQTVRQCLRQIEKQHAGTVAAAKAEKAIDEIDTPKAVAAMPQPLPTPTATATCPLPVPAHESGGFDRLVSTSAEDPLAKRIDGLVGAVKSLTDKADAQAIADMRSAAADLRAASANLRRKK